MSQISQFSEGFLPTELQEEIFKDEDVNYLMNSTTKLEDESNLEVYQQLRDYNLLNPIPQDINNLSNMNSLHSLQMPKQKANLLSNEEYPGDLDFEVCIYPAATKQPWVYSAPLNKIYMDMSNPFPIDFKTKMRPGFPLYIRITPSFSLPQHFQEIVGRCINHENEYDSTNKGTHSELERQHIIRCHNQHAVYLGDKKNNEHLNIIIPLANPHTGADSTREMFEFVCKSSCPTPGMNRKPIIIIFTLENQIGEILGRRILNVRICSCPKRDKEKEETEFNKTSGNHPVPHGKKRKLPAKTEKKSFSPVETKDMKEYTLTLTVPGKHNRDQVLKYCQDLMAGEVLRNSPQGNEGPFQKCLATITSQINKND